MMSHALGGQLTVTTRCGLGDRAHFCPRGAWQQAYRGILKHGAQDRQLSHLLSEKDLVPCPDVLTSPQVDKEDGLFRDARVLPNDISPLT